MQSGQTPPPLPRSPPPATSTSPIGGRAKTPEAKQRKSITSLGSSGSIGVDANGRVRSPSPTSKPVAPLSEQKPFIPEIQITRTESNRSTVDEKWVKPKELEEDKLNEKPKPGVPKVIKRRAPAPVSDGSDIAISRPVAKGPVDQSKGMIPPPPLKIIPMATTSGFSSVPKPEPVVVVPKGVERPPSPRPASPSPRKSPTPPPPKPLATISSFAPQSMDSLTSSSESLVKSTEPSSEANQAAASPPALRPGRKVNDVTTIKRQPKTGWL